MLALKFLGERVLYKTEDALVCLSVFNLIWFRSYSMHITKIRIKVCNKLFKIQIKFWHLFSSVLEILKDKIHNRILSKVMLILQADCQL